MKPMSHAQMQAKIDSFRAATAGSPRFLAKAKSDAAQDIGELFIYDAIGDYWGGVNAKQVVEALAQLKANGAKSLCIYVNSPGGDVFEGSAIYNNLKRFDGEKTVVVDGLAASAASVIAMVGDQIIMPDNAMMMIHDPWGFAVGNSADMRETATQLDQVRDVLLSTYVARTKGSAETIKQMMSDETWMNAADAKALGFCDTVVTSVEPDEDDDEKLQNAVVSPVLAKYRNTPAALKARAAAPLARLNVLRKKHDQILARARPDEKNAGRRPAGVK